MPNLSEAINYEMKRFLGGTILCMRIEFFSTILVARIFLCTMRIISG